jgi:hypothetical protein
MPIFGGGNSEELKGTGYFCRKAACPFWRSIGRKINLSSFLYLSANAYEEHLFGFVYLSMGEVG